MTSCMCGNPAETIGGLCGRCGALQTLGLTFMATPPEIENTYRTLVKVWHPDRFQADIKLRKAAEEKLKDINAAHEYLVSGPREQAPPPPPPPQKEPPPRPIEESFVASDRDAPAERDEHLEESEEVRRILKRQKRTRWNAPKVVISSLFTLGGIVGFALLWFAIDAFMSANATTSLKWEQFKAGVAHDIRANLAHISPGSPEKDSQPEASQTVAPTPIPAAPVREVPRTQPAELHKSIEIHKSNVSAPPVKPESRTINALPYVTSGLTPMEVLSILGKPSSSVGEKMFYNGSEIDFQNGHVSGWRIARASPIRVKAWPDAPPTPGIDTFTVGSSKNDVIAVQGTPSLFSDNEFGYGNSIVYFQNGRVVNWKEDPGSVRLKVER